VRAPGQDCRVEYHTRDDEIEAVKLHRIFRVDMAGESYALDVAASQFDHYRSVTPWKNYAPKMISAIVNTMPFKSVSSCTWYNSSELVAGFSPGVPLPHQTLVCCLELAVLKVIGDIASGSCTKLSLQLLLRQPAARYKQVQVTYQRTVMEAIHGAKNRGGIEAVVADL